MASAAACRSPASSTCFDRLPCGFRICGQHLLLYYRIARSQNQGPLQFPLALLPPALARQILCFRDQGLRPHPEIGALLYFVRQFAEFSRELSLRPANQFHGLYVIPVVERLQNLRGPPGLGFPQSLLVALAHPSSVRRQIGIESVNRA